MFMLALAEATLLSCRLTPMLLSRVITSFNPIRGLLVMDSGGEVRSVCMYVVVSSWFWRGEAFRLCPCCEPNHVDPPSACPSPSSDPCGAFLETLAVSPM